MLNKLIRKIAWNNKGKLFMISALLALTISFFMSMSFGNDFLTKNIDIVKNKYNAFDFIIKKDQKFTDKKLKLAEKKYSFNSVIKQEKDITSSVELPNFNPVIVFGQDKVQVEYDIQSFDPNAKISKPYIIDGKAPTATNEILVTKDLIKSLGVKIGDQIKIDNRNVIISGIFGNPENQTNNTTFLTEKSVKKLPILVSKKFFKKINAKSNLIIYAQFLNRNLSLNERNNIYEKIMQDKDLQRSQKFDILKSFKKSITYNEAQLCISKDTMNSYFKSKILSLDDYNKVKQIADDSIANKCSIGDTTTVGVVENQPQSSTNSNGGTSSSAKTAIQNEIGTKLPAIKNTAISSALSNEINNFISGFDKYFDTKVTQNGSVGGTNLQIELPELNTAKTAMISLMNSDSSKGLDFMAKSLVKFEIALLEASFGKTYGLKANDDKTAFVAGSMYGRDFNELNKVYSIENAEKNLHLIIDNKGKFDDNVAKAIPNSSSINTNSNASDYSHLYNDYMNIFKQYENETKSTPTKDSNSKSEKADSQKQDSSDKSTTSSSKSITKYITKKSAVKAKMVTKPFTYQKKVGTKTTYYSLLSSLVDFRNLKSSKIVTEQKEKAEVLNFVVFILLLSVLTAIVTTLITKIINDNKVEIGVLKAIGMAPGNISRSFLIIPFIVILLGFIISIPFTAIFSKFLVTFYNNEFYLPISKFNGLNITSLILSILVPMILIGGYTYFNVSYQIGINTLRLLANLGRREKNRQINNSKLSGLMKQRINTLRQSVDKSVVIAIVAIIVTIFTSIFTFMMVSAIENYNGIGSEIKTGSIKAFKSPIKDSTGQSSSINLNAFKVTDVYDNNKKHLDYIGDSHKISVSNSIDLTVLGTNSRKSQYYDLSAYKESDLTKGLILPDKFRDIYKIDKGYTIKVIDDQNRTFMLDVSGFQGKDNNLFAFTDNTYISAKTKQFGFVNAKFAKGTTFQGMSSSDNFVYLPTSAIEQSKKELLSIAVIILVGIVISILIVIPLITILVSNIYDDNKKIIATMKALGMSSRAIRQVVINPFMIIFAIASLICVVLVSVFIAPLFVDIFFNFIGRDIVYHNNVIAMVLVVIFILAVYQLIVLISTIRTNRIKVAAILNDL